MGTIKKHRVAGSRERMIAGWREWVSLPGLHIHAVKAKLDTGARTSALHAWNIEPFEHTDEHTGTGTSTAWVRFHVHPVQRSTRHVVACEAPVLSRRTIRSSSGSTEERYLIKTSVRLGQHERMIELTLTNRDQMGFRMLLGRSAMKRWLMVDPARSFLQGVKPAIVTNESRTENQPGNQIGNQTGKEHQP